MNYQDAMLLEVIARNLDALAREDGGSRDALKMVADLIRSLDTGDHQIPEAPNRELGSSQLKAYLVDSGMIGPEVAVDVLRSALGFSKDTYLATVAPPGEAPRQLAIRRDLPAGPSRTTVLDEYPLLMDLHGRGFPVAQPLLLEPDPARLGRPFMVSAGMPGIPGFTGAGADQAAKAAAADDLAVFLARLHTLPTDELPVRRIAGGGSAREELGAYFAEWRGWWEAFGPSQHAAISAAFDVLEAGVANVETLAVVHSDVGFHNILVEDGHITAVLDWEFAHLGEPEEDLSYCRQAVEALVPWDEFVAAYQAAGGPAPSPERLRAYEIWRGLRNATCCALGREAFFSGRNTDLRLGYAGQVILQACVADIRERMKTFAPSNR